jgi:RimJ/RimL family protein N-acetyltransferase
MRIKKLNPFLESENIYFIPIDDEIHDDYFKWVNDRTIIDRLETGHFPKTRQQLMEYVNSINKNPDYIFFAVIEKETSTYIGNAKLGQIKWINGTTEYGRMIGEKNSMGKGYGTEIGKLLLHYAFMILNLNKVNVGSITDNIASIKSNEKIGFEIEGELKQQVYINGSYKNTVIMGITKARYCELNQIENK